MVHWLELLVSYYGISKLTIAKMAGVEENDIDRLLVNPPEKVEIEVKYKIDVTVMEGVSQTILKKVILVLLKISRMIKSNWKIFMPIMKPSLILVGVLNMLTVWNDYLGPLIFLQDRSKYTLALGLASFKGVHSTQIIPMLCITIIMIIPPIIIFIIAQKYIVEGTSGSIK